MFHVEQRFGGGNQASEDELFHVEHSRLLLLSSNPELFHVERCSATSQLRSVITRLVWGAKWIAAFLGLDFPGGQRLIEESPWSELFHVEHRLGASGA